MYIDRIEADRFYLAVECNNQKYSKTSLVVNVAFCVWWKQNLQNSFKLYFFCIKQTKLITFELHVWTTKLIYNNTCNTSLINSLTDKQFLKSNFISTCAFYFVRLLCVTNLWKKKIKTKCNYSCSILLSRFQKNEYVL